MKNAVVSSRTPEGEPNRCPLCGKEVVIEPSLLFGDATCPYCGQLLWFLRLSREVRIYEYDKTGGIRERLKEFLAEQLGVDKSKIADDLSSSDFLGADSLDIVEIVMELEEESGQDE